MRCLVCLPSLLLEEGGDTRLEGHVTSGKTRRSLSNAAGYPAVTGGYERVSRSRRAQSGFEVTNVESAILR